jgi:L-amino acid N-acyltransferase YncA
MAAMTSDDITIRVAEPGDADAVAAIYAPIVRETAISFETEPPSADEMAARIGATLPTHPWLVAVRGGEVVGYAYGGQHQQRAAYRWSVNVSAYIDAATRRAGVGRALYGRLLPVLRAQGFRSAFAGITLPNEASVGLHEAVGFTPLGVYHHVGFKLGAWRDVGWWRLALSESHGAPVEPTDFAPFRLTSAFHALLG